MYDPIPTKTTTPLAVRPSGTYNGVQCNSGQAASQLVQSRAAVGSGPDYGLLEEVVLILTTCQGWGIAL